MEMHLMLVSTDTVDLDMGSATSNRKLANIKLDKASSCTDTTYDLCDSKR